MSRTATSYSSRGGGESFIVRLPEVGAPLGMSYGEDGDILYVGEVTPGGPFHTAGILPGDILSVDGKIINSATALLNAVKSIKDAGRTEFPVVMATQELSGSDISEGTSLSSNFSINHIPGASKALIICISYKKRPDIALYGQGRRAELFHGLIQEAGYKDVKIICDEIHMGIRPSKTNIIQGLRWLSKGAKPGDNLMIFASGHGYNSLEEEDGDIAIAPTDFADVGCITCTHVKNLLLNRLPDGCKLLAVNDFYMGGSLFDLPYEVSLPPSGRYEVTENADDVASIKGQVFMLSLQSEGFGPRVGLLPKIFLKSLKVNENPTLQTILDDIRDELDTGRERTDTLTPLVSCNRRFDIATERFCDAPKTPRPTPSTTPTSSVSSRGFKVQGETRRVLVPKKHPPPPPWLTGEYKGRDLLYDILPERTHSERHANAVDPRYRARLIQFYRYHNPSQLPRVTCMLIQYRGKEEQLFAELIRKYGEEPANIFRDLPAGWTKVATTKGEVFYRHSDGRKQWEPPIQSEVPMPGAGALYAQNKRLGDVL